MTAPAMSLAELQREMASANRELAGALTAGLLGYDPTLAYFPDLATAVPTEANGGISYGGGNEE